MSVVTVTISCNGKKSKSAASIHKVTIVKRAGTISKAKLVFCDGTGADQKYPVYEKNEFKYGAKVIVSSRFESKESKDSELFTGLVTGVSQRIDSGRSLLDVYLQDAVCAMTVVRKTTAFKEKKDEEIVKSVIGDYSDCKAGTIDKMPVKHPWLIQHNMTDFEFLVWRAHQYGLVVISDDGEVSVRDTYTCKGAEHEYEKGIDSIINAELNSDIDGLMPDAELAAWSMTDQKLGEAGKSEKVALKKEGVPLKDASSSLIKKGESLYSSLPLETDECKALASGVVKNSCRSWLRGFVKVEGDGKVKLCDTISLKGFAKVFNHSSMITGIVHSITKEYWHTDIEFGMKKPEKSDNYHQLPYLSLHTALAEDVAEDPDGEFRVQISLPWIKDDSIKLWARNTQFIAGKEYGALYKPMKGDELIVGFLGDDFRYPVVLGALYSSKNTPPKPANGDPEKTVFSMVTPKKQELVIDDSDTTIYAATAADNSLILGSEGLGITVAKSAEITVTEEMKCTVTKTLTVESDDAVNVKAGKNLSLESSGGDGEFKGNKLNLEASGGALSAKGTGATIDGGNSVDIKGAAINLN